jgi:hypothetical protein
MRLSLTKVIAILGLSIILANSGVAWALQRCSTDSESGYHIHLAQTESASTISNRAYSSPAVAVEHRHQPPSRIHCTETPILKLAFGPVSSVFRLEPPKDGTVKACWPAALLNASTSASNSSLPASVLLAVKPRLSPHLLILRFRI